MNPRRIKSILACFVGLLVFALLFTAIMPSEANACPPVLGFNAGFGLGVQRQVVRRTPFRPFVGPVLRQRLVAPVVPVAPQAFFFQPQAFVQAPPAMIYQQQAVVLGGQQAFSLPVVTQGGGSCAAFFAR